MSDTETTTTSKSKTAPAPEPNEPGTGPGLDPAEKGDVVQSTTQVTPAEADKSSLPNASDAQVDDPPVRSNDPSVPIAQTLAAGAGEHTPPDPDVFDKEGRRIEADA